MLDDLRNTSSFIDEEDNEPEEEVVQRAYTRRRSGGKETFLGMTAQQRFILSLMIFAMVCVLGAAALFVTGSIAIPGL